MPFYQGTRRVLRSASVRYGAKTFASGVAQQTNVAIRPSTSAVAQFTFNTGVTGGSTTQWMMVMNSGLGINPSDTFSFGYDGGGSAQFYFVVDGIGSGAGTAVNVSILDSADVVCSALASVATQPGFFQTSSDTMSYFGGVNESQSTPSSGSYGNVSVINPGSSDPGLYGQINCTYTSFGSPLAVDFYASYPNGSGSGTSVGTLSGNYTPTEMATFFTSGINGSAYQSFMTVTSVGPVMTVTSIQQGQVPDSSVGSGPISVSQLVSGYTLVNWPSSPYILTTNPADSQTYYVWISIGGSGSDPSVGDHPQQAALDASDSISTVGDKIANAFIAFAVGYSVNSGIEGIVLIAAPAVGPVADSTGTNPPFTVTTVVPGSLNIDTSTDTITLPGYLFPTGLPVRVTTSSSLPGGISAGVTYYVIRVTASTLKLAATRADALAGTPIDLTSAGIGNQTISQYP